SRRRPEPPRPLSAAFTRAWRNSPRSTRSCCVAASRWAARGDEPVAPVLGRGGQSLRLGAASAGPARSAGRSGDSARGRGGGALAGGGAAGALVSPTAEGNGAPGLSAFVGLAAGD